MHFRKNSVRRLKTEQLEHRLLLTTNFVAGPINRVAAITGLDDHVTSVKSVDLDFDGDLDRLVTQEHTISWFETSQSEPVQHLVSTDPSRMYWTVVADDFDKDGDVDIATAWSSPDQVSGGIEWFENLDGQNFAAESTTLIHQEADAGRFSTVVANDLDLDGDTDLIASFQDAGDLLWLENDGTGSFTTHILASETEGAYRIKVADIDSDGDMDIATTTHLAGRLDWHENSGEMQFTEHLISDDMYRIRELAVSDVDGDGHVDILAAQQQTLDLFENNGNQRFDQSVVEPWDDITPYISDVDRDGDIDLVLVFRTGDIRWYENDGSDEYVEHPVAGVGRSPVTDLIDIPGHPVTLTVGGNASSYDGRIVFAYEFTPSSIRPLAWASATKHYDQFDIDGDGDQDILGPLSWYENRNATPWVRFRYTFAHSTSGAYDINGDGHVDFFSGRTDGSVSWHESDGKGTFSSNHVGFLFGAVETIDATDANGDGHVDFLASTSLGQIVWRLNDGNNTFDNEITVVTGETSFSTALAADVVQTNGRADVVSLASDGELTVHVDEGGDTYTPYVVATEIENGANVLALDFDLDGDVDIVTARSSSVVWFENISEGTPEFVERLVTEATGQMSTFFAYDFDNDGDIDVISSSTTGTYHHVNDGTQVFDAQFVSSGIVEKFLLEDVDLDGDTDVLTFTTWALGWLRNGVPTSELDVDADGDYDCSDIAILQGATTVDEFDPTHDLNQDQRVDHDDIAHWLTFAAAEQLGSDEPFVFGDINFDGKVAADDLNALAKNWATQVTGGWCDGDFDYNGRVDSTDLNAMGKNWQSAIAAAPGIEPAAAKLNRLAKVTVDQVNGTSNRLGDDIDRLLLPRKSSIVGTNRRRTMTQTRRDATKATPTSTLRDDLVDAIFVSVARSESQLGLNVG